MPGRARRQLEPQDLFALRHIHEARLSADGQQVAYVRSNTDGNRGIESFELVIETLADARPQVTAFVGRILSPRWSPDGGRLVFIGVAGGSARIYRLNIERRNLTVLTPPDAVIRGPLSWSPDGALVACAVAMQCSADQAASDGHLHGDFRRITQRVFRSEGIGYVDDLRLAVHLIDVATGGMQMLDTGMTISMRPLFSPCGRYLLFMGADRPVPYSEAFRKGVKLFVLDRSTGARVEVLGEEWSLAEADWSACGERIIFSGAYLSELTVPTLGLWIVGRDGSGAQCRTGNFIGNVGLRLHHDMPTWGTSQANAFVVLDASHVFATVTVRGCAEIWKVVLEGPCAYEAVVAGPRACLIMDARERADVLLYAASDLARPWDLCRARIDGRAQTHITRLNDAVLTSWPRIEVQRLEYSSPDGLPLEAWFFARSDRRGAQPTVMFVHAGPFLATGNIFRFDFHLLAANGYAVLFANFRGSSGYGEAFARAIMGDWGGKGFIDHMATVDAAIAAGLADPARLGVWGASHGGFATCWIVGHSARFRAAVAESAITDFTTMYYRSDAPHLVSHDLGGRPDEIPEVYRSRSPMTYAQDCTTPTLLLHGEDDLRCPVAEAEQFYRALHDAGCKTELVLVAGMNHIGDAIGPLSARHSQNEALLDWFERHL